MDEQASYDPAAPAREFATAWFRSSQQLSRGLGQMWQSVAEANRAFVPGAASETENGTAPPAADGGESTDIEEVAFTRPGWETERSTDDWESLGVGDYVRLSKVVSDEDVASFANLSGDTNRLHLDDDFAVETRFGGRIAHGTLVSGLISAALARLPGLTIYLSQDLEFLKPVDIGSRITAVVEVVEDVGHGRYRLTTVVEDEDGDPVIDGEAVVIIDEPPEDEDED
ncbi:MAG: MaoC family dehydratase [Haloferacaceae archaeon]